MYTQCIQKHTTLKLWSKAYQVMLLLSTLVFFCFVVLRPNFFCFYGWWIRWHWERNHKNKKKVWPKTKSTMLGCIGSIRCQWHFSTQQVGNFNRLIIVFINQLKSMKTNHSSPVNDAVFFTRKRKTASKRFVRHSPCHPNTHMYMLQTGPGYGVWCSLPAG